MLCCPHCYAATVIVMFILALGTAANVLLSLPYLKGTIEGTTKPNRITWLMWSVAPLIAATASLFAGARFASVPVFVSGILCLVIFFASFINPHAYWKLTTFDYLCGLFSILALALWAITSEPTIAIVFAIVSDFFASLPTLMKCWSHPETENVGTYVGGVCNAFAVFFVLTSWDIASLAYPLWIIINDGLNVLFIYRRKIV